RRLRFFSAIGPWASVRPLQTVIGPYGLVYLAVRPCGCAAGQESRMAPPITKGCTEVEDRMRDGHLAQCGFRNGRGWMARWTWPYGLMTRGATADLGLEPAGGFQVFGRGSACSS